MNTGVMLAFLPTNTEWARQPDPHMTLVYCGTTDEISPVAFSDLAKDAISVARMMRRPFKLDVTGVEVFGDEVKVDVLRLGETPQLLMARRVVQMWNASEHPFRPHATVGPEGSAQGVLPTELFFDRMVAAYGDRQMVFRLGGDMY